eukprot:gene15967-17573_t
MVFESLVTDLLNKYLGQYVQNLDPSQLKIGIWNGDANLKNLELKDSALDDLNLPIKVVRGHLGKLELKIPWKNLYNEPTEVDIENLYLLAKPNSDIKYDKEQDDKDKLERKQKQLENIEEARKIEEEANKKSKAKETEQDSFAEKLATQVVKNLQIRIKNIHIRYEDKITTPGFPFSIGVTLDGLSALTTDSNFVPKIIKESITVIHKLVKLDNLAIYWNTNEKFKEYSRTEWLEFIESGIARKSYVPGMKHILQPINASTKLKLNTKPGTDMNIPQVFLSLLMEELAICLSKTQYHSAMEIVESFEMMKRNEPFRKYRPDTPLKEAIRPWWNYAIISILEEDVRRRFRMWSWKHIKMHRDLCDEYKKKYLEKLTQKNPSKSLIKELEMMEMKLNVVSITIFRQKALNEASRLKKKKSEDKKKGFFDGWFSSSKSKVKTTSNKSLEDLIPESQRAEEMKKLYNAIGYSENEVITPFSKEYVAMRFFFHLKKITIILKEDNVRDAVELEVMRFTLEDLFANFSQRPSANAIKVSAKVDTLRLYGTENDGITPVMVRSVQKESGSHENLALVNVSFETNPLEKPDVDQLVTAFIQPVEIVYDAFTVEQILGFFRPPQDVILKDLQDKAYSTFNELRMNSTAGLLYAMEHHSVTDISVSLKASYLIIPEGGIFSSCKNMLVIDFGSLKIISDPDQERVINIKEIDESEVQDKCYDRFNMNLTALQILLCEKDQDWNSARFNDVTPLHILFPISFDGKLAKALLPDDPRLAQIVVSGVLSGLEISLSDRKIKQLTNLANSIPIPDPSGNIGEVKAKESATDNQILSVVDIASADLAVPSQIEFKKETEAEGYSTPPDSPITNIQESNVEEGEKIKFVLEKESDEDSVYETPPESPEHLKLKSSGPAFDASIANQVKLDLDFKVKTIKLNIGCVNEENEDIPCLTFHIDDIESKIKICRWDLIAEAAIRRLVLCEMTQGPNGGPLEILSTPKESQMLQVTYRQCFFNGMVALGPQWLLTDEAHRAMVLYRDEFESTEQIIKFKFAMVYVLLHQEALLKILELVNKIVASINFGELEPKLEKVSSAIESRKDESITSLEKKKPSDNKNVHKTKEMKVKMGVTDELMIRIKAEMEGVVLEVCSSKVHLAEACFKGLSSQIEVSSEMTQVQARLKDLQVTDCSEETIYKKIISMDNEEVFDLEMVLYNNATKGNEIENMNAVDLSLRLVVGRMRAIYLHRFVMDMLVFVDNFQISQETADYAKQKAVESTVAAMASMKEYSSRNKLNVTIQAPLIIVPINSISELCLMVDLGQLKVHNRFCLIKTTSESDDELTQPAITDNMIIKLTDLKLSKAFVKNGEEVAAQRLLIEPVTLSLDLIRSLSTWNHQVPEIEAKGVLHTVKAVVSEEDIRAVMEVVNGNLKEGFEVWEKEKKTKRALSETKDEESESGDQDSVDEGSVDDSLLKDVVKTSSESGDIWFKTKFNFEVENVILEIYLKPKDMLDGEEFLERDPSRGVGKFLIGHLALSGSILSDDTISVFVLLDTLQLDDLRPDRNGVVRIIECNKGSSSDSSSESLDMFELMFERNHQLDTKVEIKLKNLLVIFNVEYIMVLANIFMSAMPQSEMIDEGEKLSLPPTPTHSIALDDDAANSLLKSASPVTTAADNKPMDHIPEFRCHVSVANPEFVLLADAQDQNTNALFLNTLLNFTYQERSGQQQMFASVADTKITSAVFKTEHRKQAVSQVLFLSSLTLHSSAPIGGKQHINVNTTVVLINLSPLTIRTVMACLNVISQQQANQDSEDDDKDLSRLWDIEDIRNTKKWYLEAGDVNRLSPGSMVWARSKSGDYQHGFLSQKDTHYNVYFYPKGEVKHTVKDNTSVILDKVPNENRIRVGSNVIASNPEKECFEVGRVKQIWRPTDDKKKSTVVESGWCELNEEPNESKYLITNYWDDKEQWKSIRSLRLLPRPNQNVTPGIGSLVYVRMKNGAYSRGKVLKMQDFKCFIYVFEINESVVRDADDPTAVVLALHPRHAYVHRGSRVICFRLQGKQYHPGRVQQIQRNEVYIVNFDDGQSVAVRIDQMVLIPKPNIDLVPNTGCFVFAKTPSNPNVYKKAIVVEKNLKRITVKFLDGKKFTYNIRDFGAVLWDVDPNAADLRVGTLIIGLDDEHGSTLTMSRGRIREIKTNSRKRTMYLIDFANEFSLWTSLSRIRMLPETDDTDFVDGEETETKRIEQLVLETEGVHLKIEGYLGGQLTPLLSVDSKLYANVRNFTSNLCANATLNLEASYFNDKVAEWEPLIEPISLQHSMRSIELEISYLTSSDVMIDGAEGEADAEEEADEDLPTVQTPITTLKIDSKDPIETTITKTSLTLLQNLGQVFSKAVYENEAGSEISEEKPPFVVHNMLGKDVIIRPGDVIRLPENRNEVNLQHSMSAHLFWRKINNDDDVFRKTHKYAKMKSPSINIKIDGFHEIKEIAIQRHHSMMIDIIPVNLLKLVGQDYSVVVDIQATEGQKIIVIRSPLQIYNHFPMPLDISYENKEGEHRLLSTIKGNEIFSVPLAVAYHTQLFVKPAGFGYKDTSEGLVWSELSGEDSRRLFVCTNDSSQPFYIQVICEEQKYSSLSGLERFTPKFTLHCYPPVVIHNYLPAQLSYRSKGMSSFEPLKGGDNWPLFSVNVAENPAIEIEVKDYLCKDWVGSFSINPRKSSDPTSKLVLMQKDNGNESLTVGVYAEITGSRHLTFFSPYWIVNKTGKQLEYQVCGESHVYIHNGLSSEALMIMIRGSNKKIKLRVTSCEWSSEFSVDTVGSDGSVKSVGKHGKTYEIGVGITLSYFSLTKIVTLTPLHMLSNHTKHAISLAEADSKVAEFHNINPGESVPFWPTNLPPKNLYINVNGVQSNRFDPVPVTTMLLKMLSEIGGICVNFQVKDAASILSFSSYFEGSAPVRIENYCPNISMVSYKQSESEKTYVLCYGQAILYTWDEPMKSHSLTCGFIEPKSSTDVIPLEKNGFGRMSANDTTVYWVSFLDGLQRVLLFTEDFKLAYKASQEQTLRPTMEVAVYLRSIGLSLVDVEKKLDICYLGIRKSDIYWEEKKKCRWKSLSMKISSALEEGYQKIQAQKSISPDANGKISLADMEVDFDKMMVLKPTKIRIRRTYHSGLSFQYTVSPNLMLVHAKVNAIQVDSHVPGSTFQTVLHPVEPPKSIASETAPKPFFELSLTTKVSEKKFVNEISYFKILIQEMDVKIDKGFLMAAIDLFTNEERRGKEVDRYKWDMETVMMKLAESPEFQAAQQDSRYFFDHLHLSPLKIHLSFSMTGGHALLESNGNAAAPIVNLLLQSVGVAFTEVQDAEFRLASFEVESSLLSQQQLSDVIQKHYQHQAIKQLYVLVFGLDVLGNPYGLISGITTGAKDLFYEPYQGLIQGPEEFAAGLALGVKSLVGGTVGGAAGAVSRITGTVGKGLAALTLDDEYQQKRRQQMSQKPTNLGQGIAKGGKSFLKGVFSGVTGIVTKPVEGAKAEGTAGFFKGVGKGLIGVVARPTGGLVDMASSTFEGLKSTAAGSKQVSQLRLTRAFHANKEAEKGKFAKTDAYVAHACIDSKTFLFVTDKKILLIVKIDILNDWEGKWLIPFTSLRTDPEIKQSTVTFHLHSDGAKKKMFSKNISERSATFPSQSVAKWFVEKVLEARRL